MVKQSSDLTYDTNLSVFLRFRDVYFLNLQFHRDLELGCWGLSDTAEIQYLGKIILLEN